MNSDKLFYVLVGGATLLIFFGILFFAGGTAPQNNKTEDKVEQQVLLGKNYHSSLPIEKAKVVVVEFSDFQCPACKGALGEVSRVKEEFKDSVAVVYKNFPLTSIHNYAYKAAIASEAAANQGKFWEYHDILFKEQATSNDPLKEEDFVEFAKELKLNEEQFKKDLESTETKQKVDDDIAIADKLNLTGTPTFFVNGERLKQSESLYEKVKSLVEK